MKSTRAISKAARTMPRAIPITAPINAVMTPRGEPSAAPVDVSSRSRGASRSRGCARRPSGLGVHDSEEADDDRQCEQDVRDVEHRLQPRDLVVDGISAGLRLSRSGNELKVRLRCSRIRTRLTALHQDKRVEVSGRSMCRSNDAAEIVTDPNGEPPRRRIEDALDVEQLAGPVRKRLSGTGEPTPRPWLLRSPCRQRRRRRRAWQRHRQPTFQSRLNIRLASPG